MRLGKSQVPVDVIPCWESETTPGRPSFFPIGAANQCPQGGHRLLLLSFSRIRVSGSPEFLLPAVVSLDEPTARAIVGGEDKHAWGLSATYKKEIDRHALGQKAVLLGLVPHLLAGRLSKGFSYFSCSSLWANFGIVKTDAMARGVPVVWGTGVRVRSTSPRPPPGRLSVLAYAGRLNVLISGFPGLRGVPLRGESPRQYIQR